MKFIVFIVLLYFILVLGAGTALNLQSWIVCKALTIGLKFGVIAIWALAVYRLIQFMQRN